MRRAAWLLGLVGLAACQAPAATDTTTTTQVLPAPTTAPAVADSALVTPAAASVPVATPELADSVRPAHLEPIRFEPFRLVPQPGPHRYQGTVGGEPATAELSWTRPDSVTGHFYQWRRGPEYQLEYYGRRRGPLVLSLSHEYPDRRRQDGTWHLARPLGSVLRGVWVDSAGRRQPVVLHESYAQGVQYEIQALTLTGGQAEPEEYAYGGVPSYTQEYLHLLGAAARQPVLRRLQAPSLAVRRRTMRRGYAQDETSYYGINVRLNDFGLLSYDTGYEAYPFGGRRQDKVEGTLVDLRTGRKLLLASQLVADHQPALRRLVAQHLLHDGNSALVKEDSSWKWEERPAAAAATPDTTYSTSLWTCRDLGPLTDELVLTSEGLEMTYWVPALVAGGSISPDYTLLIPYAELRPLVRPGTPLARMLKARGLW
ncbi:MAG: hypothetical protein ACRYFX_00345 [Janthinobacterium lividum]